MGGCAFAGARTRAARHLGGARQRFYRASLVRRAFPRDVPRVHREDSAPHAAWHQRGGAFTNPRVLRGGLPHGADGGEPRWHDADARTLCYQLDSSEDGAQLAVDRLFFIFNFHFEPQWVTLPPLAPSRGWYRAIDTSLLSGHDSAEPGQEVQISPADGYIANPRSTVVLLAR